MLVVQDSCILSKNQTNSTSFHSVHGEKVPHKCRKVVNTTHAKLVHRVARNWPIIINTSHAELPNPVYSIQKPDSQSACPHDTMLPYCQILGLLRESLPQTCQVQLVLVHNIDYFTTENQLGLVAHFTPSEYKELWTYVVSSPSARYAEWSISILLPLYNDNEGVIIYKAAGRPPIMVLYRQGNFSDFENYLLKKSKHMEAKLQGRQTKASGTQGNCLLWLGLIRGLQCSLFSKQTLLQK